MTEENATAMGVLLASRCLSSPWPIKVLHQAVKLNPILQEMNARYVWFMPALEVTATRGMPPFTLAGSSRRPNVLPIIATMMIDRAAAGNRGAQGWRQGPADWPALTWKGSGWRDRWHLNPPSAFIGADVRRHNARTEQAQKRARASSVLCAGLLRKLTKLRASVSADYESPSSGLSPERSPHAWTGVMETRLEPSSQQGAVVGLGVPPPEADP